MATKTPNYNLKKPSQSDFYNIDDQNANMDAIDAALKQNADAIEGIDLSSIPSAQKQAEWDAKPTTEQAQAMADAAEKKSKNASVPRTGGEISGALKVTNDVTAGNWSTFSSGNNGYAVYGQNCYIDAAGAYRFKNTHADLGAKGIVFPYGGGQHGIWMFDTGSVAATQDEAFNPQLKKVLNQDDYDVLFQSVSNGKAELAAVIGNLVATASFQQIIDELWTQKSGMKTKITAKGHDISAFDPTTTPLSWFVGAIDQIPTGKKYATGSVVLSSAAYTPLTLTVNGLSFTPRIVLAHLGAYTATLKVIAGGTYNQYSLYNPNDGSYGSEIVVSTPPTNGGFTMKVQSRTAAMSNTTVTWEAFE